jgi:predicted MPP superfamily phosphohydrolase
MIYYDSKYLSENLKINKAKWKRWAREFLPPDPLGGYQSGYARQFSYKEAFRVFLGGYLVGVLRLTIPEARQIISDLDDWMKKQGLYAVSGNHPNTVAPIDHIYIYDFGKGKFAYAVRTITRRQQADKAGNYCEAFVLNNIGASTDMLADPDTCHARIVLIRELHRRFFEAVAR